jgi:3-hydroxyacyl-CoA dehydrogenase
MNPPSRVAVVGAGSIGVGWAIAFARAGFEVAVTEADSDRVAPAQAEARERLGALAEFGLLDEPPAAVAARIAVGEPLDVALAEAGHVQECLPESLDLKREVLGAVVEAALADAVIASSTSAIPPSELFDGIAGSDRCLVAHPVNPPYLLPVVELVASRFTSADAVARTERLMLSAGLSPVRVRHELEGFIVNRLQGALLREAYCLLRDGVADVDEIDRAVREGPGRRWAVMGPFETADLNFRGGIAAHARALGPAYERMGAERGQHDPWTSQLVARAATQRRGLLSLEQWEERVRWRDRQLMAQEAARRAAADGAD